MKNGMMDHPSSSAIEPVIGAPTFRRSRSRYLTAKMITSTDDEQREERRHRGDEEIQVVHLGGEVGCLFGKKRDSRKHIRSHASASAAALARLAAAHQQDEAADESTVSTPPRRTRFITTTPYRPLSGS